MVNIELWRFGEVEKHKFHQHSSPISTYDVDINKIVVSNKFPFGKKGFKYSVSFKDGKKARPLCVMFPKIRAYKRDFKEKKCLFW